MFMVFIVMLLLPFSVYPAIAKNTNKSDFRYWLYIIYTLVFCVPYLIMLLGYTYELIYSLVK